MVTGMLWQLGKFKQDRIRKIGYFLFYYITKSLGSCLPFPASIAPYIHFVLSHLDYIGIILEGISV